MSERELLARLVRFAAALRARGAQVGLSDAIDGATALTLVDLGDREEVRWGLLTALKIRWRDRRTFDELFDAMWSAGALEDRRDQAATIPAPRAGRFHGPTNPGATPRMGSSRPEEDGGGEGDTPSSSPEAVLRRKPFDECTAQDLAAMERLLARLALRLATRRSRRLVPTSGRGLVDLRRSFRRALATGGELDALARRTRAVEEPKLVVLCDTSGSMDPHTRFLLTFMLSLRRVARRTEVFVFNTELTRLTPWLLAGEIGPTLDRLAAGVPDWSGGTRIGECLSAFVERHLDETVDARTVTLILSDGLDRGDPAVLAGAMRAIAARARRVFWLNPLLGDARYRPEARGMQAALPFIDRFVPAHTLESLERLLPLLTA